MYLENYQTLRKEIEEDPNKWKHILCTWIWRINISKMFMLPKAIYTSNVINSYQNINGTFYKTKINNPKNYKESKRPQRVTTILHKNNIAGTTLSDIKLYHKAPVVKTAWYWQNPNT